MSSSQAIAARFILLLALAGAACTGTAPVRPNSRVEPNAPVSTTLTARAELLFKMLREDTMPGQLSWIEMEFAPFVFDGTTLPRGDFKQKGLVREVLGNYRIETTYYDQHFQRVTAANIPGRYGAVARITVEGGLTFDRYYTLYRQPGSFSAEDWWQWSAYGTSSTVLPLPPALGIKPEVERKYANSIDRFVRFGIYEDMMLRPQAARLMAGLYESSLERGAGGPALDVATPDDIILLDRKWWLWMKRALHGQRAVKRIRRPAPIEGVVTSPTLREGPTAEATARMAGVNVEAIAELDRASSDWARTAGEPFGIAVVHNGVVVLNKRYGTDEDKALTPDMPVAVGAFTKVMTAVVTLTLVDQGVLKLDDDVSVHLPGLRGAPLARPITIRDLLQGTSGIPDVSIDGFNDMEEVVKIFFPHIKPGQDAQYVDTGYSLLGKILEAVTGQATAELYKEHLLMPLGLERTLVQGASLDAWSTPLEMAKIAQIVINGGTYGNLRFFSPQLAKEMLPKNLSAAVGHPVDVSRGLGLEAESFFRPASELRTTAAARAADKELGFGEIAGLPRGSTLRDCKRVRLAVDVVNKLTVAMVQQHDAPPDLEAYQRRLAELIGRSFIAGAPRP